MTRYVVGIDLGTTNCALSYRDLNETSSEALAIPQLTAPHTVEKRPLLPSFLYLPNPDEFPSGALALPWDPAATHVAGEFARTHGAKVPMRLVASAKSWLSHSGVDPTGPLLPWEAPPEVQRISPVDVSAQYLRHLAGAWNAAVQTSSLSESENVA
jgi:molecular chaperone DnaK (HSP70)